MKTIKILMMLLLTSAFIVSCGGPESDAKKSAELACEYFEAVDAEDKDKMAELEKENEERGKELKEKYGDGADDENGSASKEDKKAYWEAFEAEMEKCESKSWKEMKKAMGDM
tara:strand:+ start:635 stop:973 length:339 start_codon:yes stop_codon:yes gene_type:complete